MLISQTVEIRGILVCIEHLQITVSVNCFWNQFIFVILFFLQAAWLLASDWIDLVIERQ